MLPPASARQMHSQRAVRAIRVELLQLAKARGKGRSPPQPFVSYNRAFLSICNLGTGFLIMRSPGQVEKATWCESVLVPWGAFLHHMPALAALAGSCSVGQHTRERWCFVLTACLHGFVYSAPAMRLFVAFHLFCIRNKWAQLVKQEEKLRYVPALLLLELLGKRIISTVPLRSLC